jgi:signal transduction histidine kinase
MMETDADRQEEDRQASDESEDGSSVSGSEVRVQFNIAGRERVIAVPDARVEQARRCSQAVLMAPFQRRTWNELLYFCLAGLLAGWAISFIGVTLVTGSALFVTFVGAIILGCSVRGARGFGALYRSLAENLLDEHIEEPAAFSPRPGFFGWLQAALRDRTGWRTIAYMLVRIPLAIIGIWFALSVWIDAFVSLGYPLWGRSTGGPANFGLVRSIFPPGYLSLGQSGFLHGLLIVVTGVVLVFVAPWPMRLVVYADRRLMHWLLSPDSVTARMRTLERARAQTVDSSAATLRRIERDLHDGTQAQLVALAMRLGQVKEKLAVTGPIDLSRVRELVDEAHKGAKDAIVELRDLARGIHPPVLDVGLENALASLTARNPVPTELSISVQDRPTPAIEAIAYFCVAELLANVAQHAGASRASVSCNQVSRWLRLVVRDDGRGGAHAATTGSFSSGLAGLSERVAAVEGHFHLVSPAGGPTVVTVDLPLHA